MPHSTEKANVLIVGSGGVGTMAAYALEKGGKASVTAVLRSNFEAVKENGFNIRSIQHGKVDHWRPTNSKCPHFPCDVKMLIWQSSPQQDA